MKVSQLVDIIKDSTKRIPASHAPSNPIYNLQQTEGSSTSAYFLRHQASKFEIPLARTPKTSPDGLPPGQPAKQ